MDGIGTALMMCVEVLGYDHAGCIKIDEAQGDQDLKDGLKICVKDIIKKGKTNIADQIKKLTIGFVDEW